MYLNLQAPTNSLICWTTLNIEQNEPHLEKIYRESPEILELKSKFEKNWELTFLMAPKMYLNPQAPTNSLICWTTLNIDQNEPHLKKNYRESPEILELKSKFEKKWELTFSMAPKMYLIPQAPANSLICWTPMNIEQNKPNLKNI